MTDDAPQGPHFAENLDEFDQAWIESFGIDDTVAMVEGYLAVVIVIDKEGTRRWQPVIGLANTPSDSVVGIWTLAGQQMINKAMNLGGVA
jgi:hypothetical protein